MGRSLEEIEKEIAEVQSELSNVQGTETEVYARIVGYYRAVRNWNKGKQMKQQTQAEMVYYLRKLPQFEKPITIKFIWQSEKGDRRDLDNICFAKKFILDALQQANRLKNDNRKYVTGFTDEFTYADKYAVILEIEEE